MEAIVNERSSFLGKPPTGEGLTFEKVWLMFQESAKEFDRQLKETRENQKESDRQLKEKFQETDRQLKEKFQETDKQLKEKFQETDRLLKDLGKQMGELHRSFGNLAEHLVAPGIADRFNQIGFQFDSIAPRGFKILDEKKNTKTEIDVYLENSNYIIAVEVKARLKKKDDNYPDIEHHIRRLEILKEHREKHNEKRKKILGAIALAMPDSGDREAILDAGFYMLEQSGDTMKMDLPEDFIPREW